MPYRRAVADAAARFYRIPVRTDIPADSLPPWVRDARAQIKPMSLDRAMLEQHIDEWMQYWDSHIRNSSR